MGPFSLFKNLELGKASTDKNVNSHSLGLDLININVYAKVCQNIPLSSRDRAIFTRPLINVILQPLGLDLFNIKLSAKCYQNIPNGLRVKFHFFSEFEPRQNLDQSQMSFDNLMGYILSIPMRMQNFTIIFHSVQEIGPFSLFQNLELGKTSTDEK